MKRIIIGDPHGRFMPIFDIIYKEQPDEVIITGDYFDSFNIDAYTQRECYDKIIELRKEFLLRKDTNKFIMLIGNHDFHYMDENFGRCSGWNPLTCSVAGYPLCRDWENGILKMVFVDEVNKTIYSHAGVSMNWFTKWVNTNSLDDINNTKTKAFEFTYKEGGDSYGSSSWNSPLWIRPEGLKKSPYTDKDSIVWNQVFGHTEPGAPMLWLDKNVWMCDEAEFWGIDCMVKAYLIEELDDDNRLVKRKLTYL